MGYVLAVLVGGAQSGARGGDVLSLERAGDPGVAGAKGAALGHALRAGLPVPPGIVLPPDTAEAVARGDERAIAALARVVPSSGGLAVRSSACDEDGPRASHAGVFDSLLDVEPRELPAAVAAVVASARRPHVAAYRARFGLPAPVGMAVIVQRMVRADSAGVLFTRHPITGHDEVVIEAVAGVGESLAAGRVRPDLQPGRLTAHQRARLHGLAAACTGVFGPALDIEWALDGDEVRLLQVRPITAAARR